MQRDQTSFYIKNFRDRFRIVQPEHQILTPTEMPSYQKLTALVYALLKNNRIGVKRRMLKYWSFISRTQMLLKRLVIPGLTNIC